MIPRPRTQEEEKAFERAHAKVSNAVNSGVLVRPSECSDCGKESKRIQGHHENYSAPLDVIWLCPKCHNKRHKENRHGMGEPWSRRRNLWIPPMLWRKVVTAAGRETVKTGKPVTSSEIVRRSLEAYLTKQERKP